ncbi:thiol-disulfide oxidoreductase DCC family protein [Halalkalibacter akibai]|uniref:Thiol-disulfide oxidoreductase DCC family protein n=1 Tax=Halalkalibacter akibai (strain ATCC 43226 / DSM 21942 / CIP 109018 / JCM 9157 / 1139) TaxID=1236973 RepID=W4QQK7_HALA3|nr:thiol-disulfide oxidoreductase DCC family protein [Halalkalibacter akibai]GAE34366.1 hypothetical protein JCM9157_1417 [Halalkalibacter akibai JCM 9157]
MKYIILFDGVCHFCHGSVQFIYKRDPSAVFAFAALKSETGKNLIRKYDVAPTVDSLVLIEDSHVYIKSTAALRISRRLRGVWKLFYLLIIIPRPIRDRAYDIFAKNRYRWFGKTELCNLPSKDLRERLLK